MTRLSFATFSLLCGLAPLSVYGEEAPLLCALNQAFECGQETGCVNRSIEGVNLPPFVQIDLKKKQLSAVGSPDDKRSTAIEKMGQLDGKVILQGAENARGWTVDLEENTGKFTAAIADDRVAFVVFGTCIHR